jgi:hypothetical protein
VVQLILPASVGQQFEDLKAARPRSRGRWFKSTLLHHSVRQVRPNGGESAEKRACGVVAGGGTSAVWTDISGTGANHVPDIPVNALCIDPSIANTYYVGTDIGVFRTTDGGVNWMLSARCSKGFGRFCTTCPKSKRSNVSRAAVGGRAQFPRSSKTLLNPALCAKRTIRAQQPWSVKLHGFA